VDIAAVRRKLEGVRELSSELLLQGDDVEVASLSGRLRAQRRRLEAVQARHDVSVCSVKFRPSTATAADRANILGKLVIVDDGESTCPCPYCVCVWCVCVCVCVCVFVSVWLCGLCSVSLRFRWYFQSRPFLKQVLKVYYEPGRRPLAYLLYYMPTVSPACA